MRVSLQVYVKCAPRNAVTDVVFTVLQAFLEWTNLFNWFINYRSPWDDTFSHHYITCSTRALAFRISRTNSNEFSKYLRMFVIFNENLFLSSMDM